MAEAKFTVPPGYRVTRDGSVFSVAFNWRGYGEREMAQQPNSDGYPCVRLIVNGRRRRIAVHRLVAATYLPPRPSLKHQIRHLDGTRTNNAAANLAWGTVSENARDRSRQGRNYRLPWGDPDFRASQSASMRAAHASNKAKNEGRYASR